MFLVVVTNQISSLIAQFPASKRRYRRKIFQRFLLKKFSKVSQKKVQKPISKFPTKGQGGLAKKFLIQLLLKVPPMQKWKLVLFLIVGLTKVRKVQVTLESIHEQLEYCFKIIFTKERALHSFANIFVKLGARFKCT